MRRGIGSSTSVLVKVSAVQHSQLGDRNNLAPSLLLILLTHLTLEGGPCEALVSVALWFRGEWTQRENSSTPPDSKKEGAVKSMGRAISVVARPESNLG